MCFRLLRSGHTLGIGAALVGLLAATVRATPTVPFLALRSATATSGAVVVVRVEGSFHASDHTRVPFPLQLLVRDLDSGVEHVRYYVANGGFSGNAWVLPSHFTASQAEVQLFVVHEVAVVSSNPLRLAIAAAP